MHNVYIKARKDSAWNYNKLPFIVIDDAIFCMLESWPTEWRAPNLVEQDRTMTQKKKDATKLCINQLAK